MSLAAGSASRTPSGFEQLPGVTPPSSREPRSGFLTETLAEMGLVDATHVGEAVNESRSRGVAPEALLVQQGHLSDADLARARAERSGLDYVDLDAFERDPEAARLIGRQAAERFRALPIATEGRAVIVALADPVDASAISELAALSQRDVIPVIAAPAAIEARVDELSEGDVYEEQPGGEPVRLQPVAGGDRRTGDRPGGRRAGDQPGRPLLPDALATRIVERVEGALGEVARSELLKALDDATAEIERLTAELELSEERARVLERERDELRSDG
jgi:hypothetical protein